MILPTEPINHIKYRGIAKLQMKKTVSKLEDPTLWEHKLHCIFSNQLIGIGFSDIDKIVLEINDKYAEIVGYKREELIGKSWEDFSDDDYSAENLENHNKILKQEISQYTLEKKLIRKDGSRVWVEIAVQPIYKDDNSIEFLIVLIRNIDQKKLAFEKLAEQLKITENLLKNLESQNKLLKEFAHITSHNLRAPVGNIVSLIELYKSREAESVEEKQQLVEQFENISFSLFDTINTIGTALEIEERPNIKKQLIAFDELFDCVLKGLTGKVNNLDFDLDVDFTACPEIYYSRTYLKSICQNLLSNAIKYQSQERKLKITVRTFNQDDKIVLTFKDNGLGIDMERNGKYLFGLNKTFHKNKDSKGVGLFLTKKHVEAMGGKIFAESTVNQGSTFTIIFNLYEKH